MLNKEEKIEFTLLFSDLLTKINIDLSEILKDRVFYVKDTKILQDDLIVYSIKKSRKIDIESLAFWARGKVQNSIEFNKLISFLRKNEVIKPHIKNPPGTKFGYDRIDPMLLVQDMLKYYLKLNNNKKFLYDKSKISKLYNTFIKHFSLKYFTIIYFCFLENIGFSNKKIKLDENTYIKTLEREELIKLYNENTIVQEFYPKRWSSSMYKIQSLVVYEQRILKSKSKSNKSKYQIDPKIIENKFEAVCSALRLQFSSQINRSPIIHRYKDYLCNELTPDWSNHVNDFIPYESLASADKKSSYWIKLLYQKIQTPQLENSYLKLILRRITFISIRSNFEDKVLDLFICYELLLKMLTIDENDVFSNSNIIAIFTANFINEDNDRDNIYENIKKAYNIRNRIIHAKKIKQDEVLSFERAFKILRKALRKAIIEDFPKKKLQGWLLNN